LAKLGNSRGYVRLKDCCRQMQIGARTTRDRRWRAL